MKGPSSTALAFKPTEGARYKLIYLARRNPAMAAEDFPQAWKSHAALAGSFAASLGKHFVSSHQCVKDRVEGLARAFENKYDGSTILGMKSWPDLLAARYHPHALDELLKDEARVFAGEVDDWTMAVEETEIVDGKPTENVLLAYLAPAAGGAFAGESLAAVRRLADRLPGAERIVWNRVVDPAKAYPFAAIVEIWLPSRDEAIAAARDDTIAEAMLQPEIAKSDQTVCLLAKINLARATSGEGGETQWAVKSS